MSNEARLTAPKFAGPGQPFNCTIDQQFQNAGVSVAAVQFSNDPEGPWVTSQLGQGGAVEGPIVPVDERDTRWTYEGVVKNADAYFRVGFWPDQGLNGEPVVATNAVNRPCLPEEQSTEGPGFDRD